MSSDIWQLITGAVIIAIIYMLVRPNSPAAQAVTNTSGALASLIKTATGYDTSSQEVLLWLKILARS